ncbi:MAG: hypothetical protein WC807_18430 [Hyphomicrobium sp.]|jgi:hypothetical protein
MGILGGFFGSDQRKDLQRANQQATTDLQQGYDKAYGDYSSAAAGFDPYIESGNKSQGTWDDLMGLNGDGARDAAYGTLSTNPLFTGQLATSSNALSRVLNAQGQSGGGKAALAGARVLQETGGQWVDRYGQGGQMGYNATGAKGNALTARGDLSMGYGATKAGNAINFGNALAANRSTGINNILGVAGLAVNAMKPTPTFGKVG